MIWRDEECVDFDDLRESKLRAIRLREEDSDNEEDLADGEAGEEVKIPDHEGDRELIDLDTIAPNDDRDAHLFDFDPLIHLNQTATEKTNGRQIEPNLGHEPMSFYPLRALGESKQLVQNKTTTTKDSSR
ncbi:hypothetical protein OUZ56_033053 [Daphnia magna]|uniref:Uncharacterized protein n=1 Tax=Daphnia magna TaxID=35525 RepID=A0ABR0BA50_9CRUS|nr:hypothetical protein OUZ56_033053 [Daphnia magna]